MKIKRDAFLYLDGGDKHFAQCSTCVLFFKGGCRIMGDTQVSARLGSCGFYIRGNDMEPRDDAISNLTKKQTGYVERQVRCENCKFFSTGDCMLFEKLNGLFPELFALDTKVERHGCCNAQSPD